jgi:hypothetical protein|tara:strand:+ start:596 stop:1276 length:681 start_codon:yes stop_codon:yes gene_type:complete
MARISSYPFDLTVQDNDAWIGSNSTTRATKQFTAKAVAEYLNISGKISISGQMVFKFSTAPIGNGEFIGPANGSAITSIATIQLSNIDASGQDYVAFMQYLVGNNILISEQNNISNFGHFSITSFGLVAGVYQMSLVNIGGNGNLELTKSYDFASFTLVSDSDKTFVFTQGVAALVWTVNHNLAKFPSVSVVDTANTGVISQIDYIDNNNLTITNTAQFAGKAYLN